MNIEEIQDIWDSNLIRAWHQDRKLSVVHFWTVKELGFYGMTVPKKAESILQDYINAREYINDLGIKRGAEFRMSKLRVRVFMARYLTPVSEALWNGKVTDRVILKRMKDMNIQIKDSKEARQNAAKDRVLREEIVKNSKQYAAQYFKCISTKDIKRSNQWGTTKAVRSK